MFLSKGPGPGRQVPCEKGRRVCVSWRFPAIRFLSFKCLAGLVVGFPFNPLTVVDV